MLTLTPNRRLAAFLIREHNARQIAAGQTVWNTPQIIHLKGWFTQLWQVCCEIVGHKNIIDCYPLVSDVQQQLIWEDIIRNSSMGVELLRIAATAKNTIQAWKFLRQWDISVSKLEAYAEYSQDTQAFHVWLESYLQWLRLNKYLDYELMLDELIVGLPHIIAKLPTKICLVGIDELTPQQDKIFKLLQQHDIEILQQSILQEPEQTVLHSFANKQIELQAAAQWAKDLIETDEQKIIGVVVPNLEMQRREVVRIFSNLIAPELMNISAPASLSDFMPITHALLILQITRVQFFYESLSILLRSPYTNNGCSEVNVRAWLDRKLRECVEAKLTWHTLAENITTILATKENTSSFLHGLAHEYHAILELTVDDHKPSVWAQIFNKILRRWGWPGDRGLDQTEMDLVTCWQDLLTSYSKLDILGFNLSFNDALQLLQRMANETPFLPAETGRTRLHVLGVLEAAGICFDELWVTGMDRDNWPPAADPNPFIPGELQRQYDIPRSSPQRELNVARRLTANLRHGARINAHFSYSQIVDDHQTAVSNLLADVPLQEITTAATLKHWQAAQLESYIDINAPQYGASDVKGGASVLQLQAQCPFKAFAEIRMQAKKLEKPQLILNALERGKIVHAVMERFWKKCSTQAQLFAWLPTLSQKILSEIVLDILTRWQQKFPITLNDNYIALEKTRLENLLSKWLEYELARAPFTVTAIEEKIIANIGPLRLNVRADRIDTLTSGDIVIIDYKTGVTQVADWFKEAIQEPQMPLYAVTTEHRIAAVVYANLVAQHDRLRFSGIANSEVLPDVKLLNDWDTLLNNWKMKLHDYALNFADGVAAVQPYSEQVCKRCSLQALCRIYDC